MSKTPQQTVLIVGAGGGLSAACARLFAGQGYDVALAARDTGKLSGLCAQTGAKTYACDASSPAAVDALFAAVAGAQGAPGVVIYNPSYRARGPIAELDVDEVRKALDITAFGGFLVGRAAARQMLAAGGGTILFTGASASVKGYSQSAPFAMGKFALRGLAQSMARELHPRGIHVGHIVVDGGIRSATRTEPADQPDSMLDPDALAATYLQLVRQPRSAWSWEIELRPWVERF